MSDNYLTEDITDIPLDEVVPLLTALDKWRNESTRTSTKMFQASWYDKGSKVAMNNQSGYVFLTNEEWQVAMIDNGKLTMFLNCGECGNEGLENDFVNTVVFHRCCQGCKDIMKDIKESNQ